MNRFVRVVLASLGVFNFGSLYPAFSQGIPPTLQGGCASQQFPCFEYSNLNVPIAGVAGGNAVVFVGEPLNGSVVVLSRFTGQQIAELPPPPNGFVLPFIMHSLGDGHLAVLDAGGLP